MLFLGLAQEQRGYDADHGDDRELPDGFGVEDVYVQSGDCADAGEDLVENERQFWVALGGRIGEFRFGISGN